MATSGTVCISSAVNEAAETTPTVALHARRRIRMYAWSVAESALVLLRDMEASTAQPGSAVFVGFNAQFMLVGSSSKYSLIDVETGTLVTSASLSSSLSLVLDLGSHYLLQRNGSYCGDLAEKWRLT